MHYWILKQPHHGFASHVSKSSMFSLIINSAPIVLFWHPDANTRMPHTRSQHAVLCDFTNHTKTHALIFDLMLTHSQSLHHFAVRGFNRRLSFFLVIKLNEAVTLVQRYS